MMTNPSPSSPDPNSPDWLDGYETAKAETRLIVYEVLASMGGDMLSTYGKRHDADLAVGGNTSLENGMFNSLGGYLLQRFGDHSEVSAETTEPGDG